MSGVWRQLGRFGAAWAFCVFVAHLVGSALVSKVSPAISLVSELIHPATAVTLVVRPQTDEIEVRTFLLRPVRLSDSISLRGHSRLPVTWVDSNHLVVPAAIMLTIFLAMPAPSLSARSRILLIGTAAAIIVMVINAGLLVAGKIDIVFLEAYLKAGLDKEQSVLIWLIVLLETGIGSTLAIGLAFLVHGLLSRVRVPRLVES